MPSLSGFMWWRLCFWASFKKRSEAISEGDVHLSRSIIYMLSKPKLDVCLLSLILSHYFALLKTCCADAKYLMIIHFMAQSSQVFPWKVQLWRRLKLTVSCVNFKRDDVVAFWLALSAQPREPIECDLSQFAHMPPLLPWLLPRS